ncbi:hypothetical protein HNQ91_004950 [Filimonas zeae]|uniref:Spermatogenesis-associated protein 20-like TRX domain-containing protein n=1 Tax=Filimonas zeae TaxID=1737353 RepID=A0A917J5M3_9BACT|nr:thioredoxin domain-containing protein [Filimonas zeae]MDR6341873.1 hypothetical protein [Filimonas zeae]GGH80000.1 hypothetical protein GCM10011379_50220 [Filimonas zeae]
MANRLLQETSPYLLQHAHNPVNWYAWGEEALLKAKAEDKPILVSIGYAACHWCHVMERESFENEETAAMMNRIFVNIKIDREERPDLDHIYMDAVQAMTGSGGWPLNVFLTPDLKPFYGGTYFPPVRAFNRSSWRETLAGIEEAWNQRRDEIEAQSENLTAHLANANSFGINRATDEEKAGLFTTGNLQQMVENIQTTYDAEWGGFGKAPKFPQTYTIRFLLRQYHFTGNESAAQQALNTLDKMIQGGIYDQLGGGFARYSTDKEWFAPHFEKMLYDNALLVGALAEAYQLTQEPLYKAVIEETLAFTERELMSPDFGFYSALDADSEGVEGLFYTWQKAEIDALLGEDAPLFCALYNVTEEGNWHEGHTNILWLPESLAEFARNSGLTERELADKIQQWKQLLMPVRSQRIRPLLDDKILLGWNLLMNTAYCEAFSALGNPHYLEVAEKNIRFLETHLKTVTTEWKHTWKDGQVKFPAFLDDYSYLVQAYLKLQEVTGDADYLLKAKEVVEYLEEHFGDEEGGYFMFTHRDQQDIVLRKKEVYDGATPSGNAIMANNLYYLSIIFDNRNWQVRAEKMISGLGQAIVRYPTSFGCWALLLQAVVEGVHEVAVVGENAAAIINELITHYIPVKIIQRSGGSDQFFPLLENRKSGTGQTQIFLCKNYSCQRPVTSVKDFLGLLRGEL